MPNITKVELSHGLLRRLFSYDPQRGLLVRKVKPSPRGTGRGNVGDILPASFTKGSGYGLYVARVLNHTVNYPRLVWMWHHKNAIEGQVRVKPGGRRDDFRIENLELVRKGRGDIEDLVAQFRRRYPDSRASDSSLKTRGKQWLAEKVGA